MSPSESEDEGLEDVEFDDNDDPEADIEDDALDAAPDDATEDGDDVCFCLHSNASTSPSYILSVFLFVSRTQALMTRTMPQTTTKTTIQMWR